MIELTERHMLRALVPVYAVTTDVFDLERYQKWEENSGERFHVDVQETTPEFRELKASPTSVCNIVKDASNILGTEIGARTALNCLQRRTDDVRWCDSLLLVCEPDQTLHESLHGLIPRFGAKPQAQSFALPERPDLPLTAYRQMAVAIHQLGGPLLHGHPCKQGKKDSELPKLSPYLEPFQGYHTQFLILVLTGLGYRTMMDVEKGTKKEFLDDGRFTEAMKDVREAIETNHGWSA